jgi:hypothetical protein
MPEVEVTPKEALDTVCEQIAKADKSEKRAKKEKEAARAKFFELATDFITANWTLASEAVHVDDFEGLKPLEWVEKNHIGYRIDTMDLHDDGSADLVIEQDPALLKFEWVQDKLKLVFSRQVAQVGSSFDAQQFWMDACAADMADLADDVIDQQTVYSLDGAKAEKYMAAHPEATALFQDYTHPGTLQVKLGAPRKAKDEE